MLLYLFDEADLSWTVTAVTARRPASLSVLPRRPRLASLALSRCSSGTAR